MQELTYWRAGSQLPLIHAALLIIGEYPYPIELNSKLAIWDLNEIPGFIPALGILYKGLKEGTIKGTIVYYESQTQDEIVFVDQIDEIKSTVLVDSLKEYLTSRGLVAGTSLVDELLKRKAANQPDYLNPNHVRYAPKLAAAVNAWIEVGKSSENSPRTPKQQLEQWLLNHAASFRLVNDQGRPNKFGIEEVAKVANWKTEGGAPKTRTPKTKARKFSGD